MWETPSDGPCANRQAAQLSIFGSVTPGTIALPYSRAAKKSLPSWRGSQAVVVGVGRREAHWDQHFLALGIWMGFSPEKLHIFIQFCTQRSFWDPRKLCRVSRVKNWLNDHCFWCSWIINEDRKGWLMDINTICEALRLLKNSHLWHLTDFTPILRCRQGTCYLGQTGYMVPWAESSLLGGRLSLQSLSPNSTWPFHFLQYLLTHTKVAPGKNGQRSCEWASNSTLCI